MMRKVLITGATGNIGREVVQSIFALNVEVKPIAAVRNVERAKESFQKYPSLSYRTFDFENPQTFEPAFKEIDILFVLRPPHISQVDKIFRPLLDSAKNAGIENIIFLSVQGAEKSKLIPHNTIERLITEFGFRYIFVRPSYFMQNLTTALRTEIVDHQRIVLPSKNAMFNWIDAKDIGMATAYLIKDFGSYKNKAFEITGSENLNFSQIADELSRITSRKIKYKSINPIRFYFKKRKEGINHGFALVMTLLHFLPRVQDDPEITNDFETITGEKPTTLREFIVREKDTFIPLNA
jgi:uncharacterized protein YbjT (DUF2867 family)